MLLCAVSNVVFFLVHLSTLYIISVLPRPVVSQFFLTPHSTRAVLLVPHTCPSWMCKGHRYIQKPTEPLPCGSSLIPLWILSYYMTWYDNFLLFLIVSIHRAGLVDQLENIGELDLVCGSWFMARCINVIRNQMQGMERCGR